MFELCSFNKRVEPSLACLINELKTVFELGSFNKRAELELDSFSLTSLKLTFDTEFFTLKSSSNSFLAEKHQTAYIFQKST